VWGRKNCFILVGLLAFFLPRVVAQAQSSDRLTVAVEPATPLIEHRDGRQLLNFDLAVSNRGKSTLRLAEIEVSAFDSTSHLVLRKAVNSNGLAPGIDIAARLLLAPGENRGHLQPVLLFWRRASHSPHGIYLPLFARRQRAGARKEPSSTADGL
jgi:hypothetical protein